MNVRRTLLVSMALLTALSAPALAQKEHPVKLSLSHLKPSEVSQMFLESLDPKIPVMLPNGITMISPDDVNRCLLIQGTADGIKNLREMIRLVDVRQKTMRLDARILLQNPAEGTSQPKQEVIATATVQMTNNRQGEILLVGQGRVFRIQITPHINGDGTFTLSTRLSNVHRTSNDGGYQSQETATTRRMPGGTAKVIAGLGIGSGPSGNVLQETQNFDVLYQLSVPMFLLEVTPTATSPSGVEGKTQTVQAVRRKQPKQTVK